jgi:hypothetical protein
VPRFIETTDTTDEGASDDQPPSTVDEGRTTTPPVDDTRGMSPSPDSSTSATTNTSEGSGAGSETNTDGTTTTGEGSGTAGAMIPEVCIAYGDAIEVCFPGYGEYSAELCATYHTIYGMYYGADCVTAFEDWLVCLSALTCEELMMDPGTICIPEQDAVDMVCMAM